MDLQEAIVSRRSVKHYQPGHSLTDDELKQLIGNGMLAPTSFNMQNWHVVAVRDQETKEKIKAAAWNQDQCADCSVVLVLCGDFTAQHRHARYLRNAPEKLREMFVPLILGAYDGKTQALRDEGCRSVGFVGQNIMLTARAMGYDSCPMIGFDPTKISAILGLDDDHPPLLMITVGKAAKPAQDRPGLMNFEEMVSLDSFGNHSLAGAHPESL
jgi:nitroreductase